MNYLRLYLALLSLSLLACGDITLVGSPEGEGDDPGECSDESDNDLDTLWDCDDPDCVGSPDCAGDDDDSVGDDDDSVGNDDDSVGNDDDSVGDDDDSVGDDNDSAGDDDDSTGPGDAPATGTGTCTSGAVSSWSANPALSPELNIIGMYESDGGHGAPAGTTTVQINRTGPMVLMLSSYEPVIWELTLAAGVDISEVILNGYNPSTVTGLAASTTVTDLTTPLNHLEACAYEWPIINPNSGCDTGDLISATEALTGLQLNSFLGCYHGTAWTLD